jgi:hypothetical protein
MRQFNAIKTEKQIIKSAKEFAKVHNIPFDKRHEQICVNSIREYHNKVFEYIINEFFKKPFDLNNIISCDENCKPISKF